MFAVGHEVLADLFVGKQYRSGSSLMPWIAAGYAIRSTSYVFERVCYANERVDESAFPSIARALDRLATHVRGRAPQPT